MCKWSSVHIHIKKIHKQFMPLMSCWCFLKNVKECECITQCTVVQLLKKNWTMISMYKFSVNNIKTAFF